MDAREEQLISDVKKEYLRAQGNNATVHFSSRGKTVRVAGGKWHFWRGGKVHGTGRHACPTKMPGTATSAQGRRPHWLLLPIGGPGPWRLLAPSPSQRLHLLLPHIHIHHHHHHCHHHHCPRCSGLFSHAHIGESPLVGVISHSFAVQYCGCNEPGVHPLIRHRLPFRHSWMTADGAPSALVVL